MGSVERISRTARPAPSKDGVDLARGREDAPAIPRGGLPMRYKVGAEQLQQVPTPPPSPRHRLPGQSSCPGRPDPRGLDQDRRAACGITAEGLEVLDQDWEQAFFVEKCPGCFAAVLAGASDEQDRPGRRP
jgi:hypothetical protein